MYDIINFQMVIIDRHAIGAAIDFGEAVDLMREALIAHSRGECCTPMPMHLDIAPVSAEVHMKSSYKMGGRHFVLKIASSFPQNAARGLATGNGVMLLCSAETGETVALLDDKGHLTDVRTAAVSAMVARELGRQDRQIGIVGTGIQARLQVLLHRAVLPIEDVFIWGRRAEALAQCVEDLSRALPEVRFHGVDTPAQVAFRARLIATCTASRAPLLHLADLEPGTHISAVGADSPGKQELDPRILESAALVLADSVAQCERLGELQHAPAARPHTIEIGSFAIAPVAFDRAGITVCDFTGLGVEDLYIAEHCYDHHQRSIT